MIDTSHVFRVKSLRMWSLQLRATVSAFFTCGCIHVLSLFVVATSSFMGKMWKSGYPLRLMNELASIPIKICIYGWFFLNYLISLMTVATCCWFFSVLDVRWAETNTNLPSLHQMVSSFQLGVSKSSYVYRLTLWNESFLTRIADYTPFFHTSVYLPHYYIAFRKCSLVYCRKMMSSCLLDKVFIVLLIFLYSFTNDF